MTDQNGSKSKHLPSDSMVFRCPFAVFGLQPTCAYTVALCPIQISQLGFRLVKLGFQLVKPRAMAPKKSRASGSGGRGRGSGRGGRKDANKDELETTGGLLLWRR